MYAALDAIEETSVPKTSGGQSKVSETVAGQTDRYPILPPLIMLLPFLCCRLCINAGSDCSTLLTDIYQSGLRTSSDLICQTCLVSNDPCTRLDNLSGRVKGLRKRDALLSGSEQERTRVAFQTVLVKPSE